MNRRANLVVVPTEHGLDIAQYRRTRNGPQMVRQGHFELAGDTNWQSESAGGQLAGFLRRGHWPGRAVLGVPAGWCLFRELNLPAMNEAEIPAALSIQAERLFAGSDLDLVADYAPPFSSPQISQIHRSPEGGSDDAAGGAAMGRGVMLSAVPRERLDRMVGQLAEGGVRAASALPVVLAVWPPGELPGAGARLYIRIRDGAADVGLWQDGRIRSAREITFGDLRLLTNYLRTFMASTSGAAGAAATVINSSGYPEVAVADAVARAGLRQASEHMVNDDDPAGALLGNIARIALRNGGAAQLDFLNPRLGARSSRRLGRRRAWAAAAAVLVLLAGAPVILDNSRLADSVGSLDRQLKEMKPDLEAAERVVEQAAAVREWLDRSPRLLECQLTLASAFGTDSSVWAASVAMRDDLAGMLTGNAATQRDALNLLERLRGMPGIADVTLVHVRDSGTRTGEVSFAIRFQFFLERGGS